MKDDGNSRGEAENLVVMIKALAQVLGRIEPKTPTQSLQYYGHCLIPGAFSAPEIERLRESIDQVFAEFPYDERDGRSSPENAEMFRYEMINRSEEVRKVTLDRRILDTIEPVLGKDCHMITSTAWRNPANVEHAPRGQEWHVDAGPFVPRDEGIPWPEKIPYPIFVIGVHVFIEDANLEDGPTAVLEGSHKSGRRPPEESQWDTELEFNGKRCVPMIAKAGDIGMFVSDAWHRRLPPLNGCTGRYFLQTNYGRRDIAQRIKPACETRHIAPEVIERTPTLRERMVLGDHPQGLYDG